jgi:transcription elongation factor
MFRNGFLYLPIRINSLVISKVNPRLEEVQRFQQQARLINGASMDDFLSDKDEWDILDDETLQMTIRD